MNLNFAQIVSFLTQLLSGSTVKIVDVGLIFMEIVE